MKGEWGGGSSRVPWSQAVVHRTDTFWGCPVAVGSETSHSHSGQWWLLKGPEVPHKQIEALGRQSVGREMTVASEMAES